MKTRNVYTEYLKTLRSFHKYYLYLLPAVLADFIFTIIYFLSGIIYNDKMGLIMQTLDQSLAFNVQGLVENLSGRETVFDLFRLFPEITNAFKEIMLNSFLLALAVAISYLIFHSIAWYYCNKILNKRLRFSKYVQRFTITSLVWIVILIVINYIVRFFEFISLIKNTNSGMVYGIILNIVFFIVFYFAIVSYRLLDKKKRIRKSLRIGFKSKHLLAYLIIVASVIILGQVVAFIPVFAIRLILNIILILPFISLMRIYWLKER